MDVYGDVEESSRRVQVRFVIKLQPPYKALSTSITIPSILTRMGLSAIVNNLFKAGNADWKPEPFDFLIYGELVRMSLEELLLAKGMSAEKILEIEYVKAVAPCKEDEPSLHDDWVSAVDGSDPRVRDLGSNIYHNIQYFHCVVEPSMDGSPLDDGIVQHLANCYGKLRGCVRIFWRETVLQFSVVKSKGVESGADLVVATASKDRTLRLWKFDLEDSLDHPKKIRASKILRGHNASVQSVAAQPSGDMVCSGSWDCKINLWQTNESDAGDNLVPIKKRKKDGEDEESQSEGEAVSTLVGHTQCVSSVVWPQHETIYSASWDHSIRRWDVETGKDSLNMFCGKVINCLDIGGESSTLIAAGGSDLSLGCGILASQFSSHTSSISACKWHEKSWFHLVSASYDGKVMLWDLRTAWPLAVIDSHEDKVLCADWWKGDSVISGGGDSKLCISPEIYVH